MFDIHCHLIYGIDDGSSSLDETVRMIALASSGGTLGIVATPHCNIPGIYNNYWNKLLYDRLNEIRNAVVERNIPVDIYSGQEIFLTNDTVDLLKNNKLITINNSRYPLVEFSFDEYSDIAYSLLRQLISNGYSPVLAHPERYYFIQEDESALMKLKRMGVILQMNKGSIDGMFGVGASYVAEYMLEKGLVDVLASDAHSPYSRTPYLEDLHEYISDSYDMEYADLLLDINPFNIISNRNIDSF